MIRGRGPFEGTVSAQKALQGSKMNRKRELLGGTKKNHILPNEESLPSRQINDLFKKCDSDQACVSLQEVHDHGPGGLVVHVVAVPAVGGLRRSGHLDLAGSGP